MKFINLTPHAIELCNNDGSVFWSFPASGQIARCAVNTTPVSFVDVAPGEAVMVPLVMTVFGAVSGLPAPQADTMYIVSLLVKQAAQRQDVVSPGEMVRDADGKIIGCKNFNT